MPLVQPDQWLGSLLGKAAYRLVEPAAAFNDSDIAINPAMIWARVPAEQVSALLKLQARGFNVIDTNLQFVRQAAPLSLCNHHLIRPAQCGDEEQVRALARSSFHHNRFHRDPEIANHHASRIKEEWAGGFFSGNRGDWMLVAEANRSIAGFLQILKKNDQTIVIDLIATAELYRGQGFAKAMIAYASMHCLDQPPRIEVGTQLGNTASIALYEALGFRFVSAFYVLHRHIGRDDPK